MSHRPADDYFADTRDPLVAAITALRQAKEPLSWQALLQHRALLQLAGEHGTERQRATAAARLIREQVGQMKRNKEDSCLKSILQIAKVAKGLEPDSKIKHLLHSGDKDEQTKD